MKISPDTQNVIDFLDEISDGSLKQKDDLAFLLEAWAATGQPDATNFMIESGASLHRVSETIKKAQDNPEALAKLDEEEFKFQTAVRINIMSVTYDSEKNEYFELKYRQLTEECYQNMRDLAHDLHLLRKLQKTSREMNQAGKDGEAAK